MTTDISALKQAVTDIATALSHDGHPATQPEYRRILGTLKGDGKPRLLTPGQRAAQEDRGRALTRDEMVREDRADILAKATARAQGAAIWTLSDAECAQRLRPIGKVEYDAPVRQWVLLEDLAALLEGR